MSRTGRPRPVRGGDGLEQGPAHQEPLGVQLAFEGLRAPVGGHARRLRRPQVQELAGVVPLVHGLVAASMPFVALQPEQLAAGPAGRAPWPPRSCRRPPRLPAAAAAGAAWRGRSTWPGPRRPGTADRPGPRPPRRPTPPSSHPEATAAPSPQSSQAPAASRARRVRTWARWRRYSVLALRSAGGSVPSAATAAASAADAPGGQRLLHRGRPQRRGAHVDQADPGGAVAAPRPPRRWPSPGPGG